MKRTDVELWHATDCANAIRENRGLFGTQCDQNVICGSVGLTKIWTCAESEHEQCCSRGGTRIRIRLSALENASSCWHAYRTRNWGGYRREGRNKHVFYNFFLVPTNSMLTTCQAAQLVRADCRDLAPVQLCFEDGALFVLERGNPDDTETDTTTTDIVLTDEKRHFHVAIVASFLPVDAISLEPGPDETTTTTTTADDCGWASPDSTTTSAEEASSLDSTTTTTNTLSSDPGSTSSSTSSSASTEEVPDENGITCHIACNSWDIELPGTGDGIRHLLFIPPKAVPQPVRSRLKEQARLYVGTSRNAQQFPDKVAKDRECWDDALEDMLRHAGQQKDDPFLCILDIQRWHSKLMRFSDPARAGVQRTVSGARCGARRFVAGPLVERALISFLCNLSEVLLPCDNVSAFGKAAWCCYHIIRIHPFSDGNGRLGRLLAMWTLRVCGFPLVVQLCDIGADREGFIQAIRTADNNAGRTWELATFIAERCEAAARLWRGPRR